MESEYHELLEDVSTQELLDRFEVVRNDKASRSDCAGNLSYECFIDGLKGIEGFTAEYDLDYAVIGGIGTQLRALADSGDQMRLMKHFGNRVTTDIDVLVHDRNDALQSLNRSSYYEPGDRPDIDFVNSKTFNHDTELVERIISDAEYVDFQEVDERFDFTVAVPTNSDLVYSKVWDPKLQDRAGTYHDLKKHVIQDGYLFDLDETALRDRIYDHAPDPDQSLRMLESAGLTY